MWPFKHKHEWITLGVKSGRTEYFRDGHLQFTEMFWYYDCPCGTYQINGGQCFTQGKYPNDEFHPISVGSPVHKKLSYIIHEHTPWVTDAKFETGDKVRWNDNGEIMTVEESKITPDGRIFYYLICSNGCAFLSEDNLERIEDNDEVVSETSCGDC